MNEFIVQNVYDVCKYVKPRDLTHQSLLKMGMHALNGTFFITWQSLHYLLIGTDSIWYADSYVINCIYAININFGAWDVNSDNLPNTYRIYEKHTCIFPLIQLHFQGYYFKIYLHFLSINYLKKLFSYKIQPYF